MHVNNALLIIKPMQRYMPGKSMVHAGHFETTPAKNKVRSRFSPAAPLFFYALSKAWNFCASLAMHFCPS
jgi:hypothetical protein